MDIEHLIERGQKIKDNEQNNFAPGVLLRTCFASTFATYHTLTDKFDIKVARVASAISINLTDVQICPS